MRMLFYVFPDESVKGQPNFLMKFQLTLFKFLNYLLLMDLFILKIFWDKSVQYSYQIISKENYIKKLT